MCNRHIFITGRNILLVEINTQNSVDKKSESKYKRDKKGDLVSPLYPICQE